MRSSRLWGKLLGYDGTVIEDVDWREEDSGDGSGPALRLIVRVRPHKRLAHRCGICGEKRPHPPVPQLAYGVSRWAPSTARWVKMGLNVLGLPGGNGVIREPYLLPGTGALAEMRAGFETLGLSEREASVSP